MEVHLIRDQILDLNSNQRFIRHLRKGRQLLGGMALFGAILSSSCTRSYNVESSGSVLDVQPLDSMYVTQENTPKTFDLAPLIPRFRKEESKLRIRKSKQEDREIKSQSVKTEHGTINEIDDDKGLTIKYTPDPDYYGTDSFSYQLYIGATNETRIISQNIIVEQMPDAPSAPDQTIMVDVGVPFEFSIRNLSAHDPQGSPLDLLLIDEQGNIIDSVVGKNEVLKLTRRDQGLQNNIFQYVTQIVQSRSFTMLVTNSFGMKARFKLSFDSRNTLLNFKPALAVRNTSCVFCHSSVKGNVISDLNSNGNKFDLAVGGIGDFVMPNWESWAARSTIGTVFLEGTYYVPNLKLTGNGKALAQEIINESKNKMANLTRKDANGNVTSYFGHKDLVPPDDSVLLTNTPDQVTTVSEYLNSVLNFRTSGYLSLLKDYSFANLMKAPGVDPSKLVIREIPLIKIGAPPAEVLRKYVSSKNKITYFKQGVNGLSLSHFSDRGNYSGNDPGEVMDCDGDLFIEGPVFLNDLKINSINGCRIYATGTVFIQAPTSSNGNPDGIVFVGSENSTLQITSSLEIMLGLGACSSPPRDATRVIGTAEEGSLAARKDRREPAQTIGISSGGPVYRDYNKIRDVNGRLLLKDVGDCQGSAAPERQVSIKRTLLNAPRIDSRYTGNFSGIIISNMLVWSLGKFYYSYDNTFDKVAVLPAVSSDYYFHAEDCVAPDGTDQSIGVSPSYRVCK